MNKERDFLAALVLSKDPALLITSMIREEYFTTGENKQALAYVRKYITTHHKMPEFETLCGDLNIEFTVPKEPYEYYRDVLEKRFLKKQVNSALQQSSDLLKAGKSEDIIELWKKVVRSTALSGDGCRLVNVLKDGADLLMFKLTTNLMGKANIPFGWGTLDQMCGGLQEGDVACVCGRPGSGKTYLTLHVAANAAFIEGKRVLYISTEMQWEDILERLSGVVSKHSITKIKKGQYLKEEKVELHNLLTAKFTKAGGSFDIVNTALSNFTVEDIDALVSSKPVDLIVIDGAYLLDNQNPRLDQYNKVADNTKSIKRLAMNHKLSVFCSFQLNREAKKKKAGERPTLEDIGYSDVIGQICTVVLSLTPQGDATTVGSCGSTKEVDILKGRNGEVGQFHINWLFNPTDFTEYLTGNEEKTCD